MKCNYPSCDCPIRYDNPTRAPAPVCICDLRLGESSEGRVLLAPRDLFAVAFLAGSFLFFITAALVK